MPTNQGIDIGRRRRLSEDDQVAIYRHLGLTRSADGDTLLVMGGEDAGPAHFSVQPEDLDADGRIEVFILGGNTFLSGESGSSVWLFTRSAPDGGWQMNLGIPAASYRVRSALRRRRCVRCRVALGRKYLRTSRGCRHRSGRL